MDLESNPKLRNNWELEKKIDFEESRRNLDDTCYQSNATMSKKIPNHGHHFFKKWVNFNKQICLDKASFVSSDFKISCFSTRSWVVPKISLYPNANNLNAKKENLKAMQIKKEPINKYYWCFLTEMYICAW